MTAQGFADQGESPDCEPTKLKLSVRVCELQALAAVKAAIEQATHSVDEAAGVVESTPWAPIRALPPGRTMSGHESDPWRNEMTIHKLRAALAALLALVALAAFAATATAYQSVEHTTWTTYKQLIPGNSKWNPIVLKRGITG